MSYDQTLVVLHQKVNKKTNTYNNYSRDYTFNIILYIIKKKK